MTEPIILGSDIESRVIYSGSHLPYGRYFIGEEKEKGILNYTDPKDHNT
ncbi:MAG: hypothetical protein JW704_06715 [Anaerolineaceae bacterium]|nr:hypothetical protein [Anaerolineaceae bacterium]